MEKSYEEWLKSIENKEPKIKNKWIVKFGLENERTPKIPNFEKLEDAKVYIDLMFSDYAKIMFIDGGEILHIANDKVVSSVLMNFAGNNSILFSEVHIKRNPEDFIE